MVEKFVGDPGYVFFCKGESTSLLKVNERKFREKGPLENIQTFCSKKSKPEAI